jgi:hypothetical protein
VKAEDAVLGKNGSPDIEKIKPFLYAPDAGMGYYEYPGKYSLLEHAFSRHKRFYRKRHS